MAIAKKLGAALLFSGVLSGCAAPGGNPADPLEPLNRSIFSFNDAVDGALIKPAVVPSLFPGVSLRGRDDCENALGINMRSFVQQRLLSASVSRQHSSTVL